MVLPKGEYGSYAGHLPPAQRVMNTRIAWWHATTCLRLDDAQLTQLPQRLHKPADFEPAFANAKREKRKTSRYIAGYLDERAALHLSFLPARRSHVFPMTPVSLFALISVRAIYLSCAARLHAFRKPFSRLPRFPGDE